MRVCDTGVGGVREQKLRRELESQPSASQDAQIHEGIIPVGFGDRRSHVTASASAQRTNLARPAACIHRNAPLSRGEKQTSRL